ncbi:MAG: hypothetical protein J1F11_04855 [Oscillospiraceae bacterium]|nr:hypothetical protein [Oscillospiraceae bacterium]
MPKTIFGTTEKSNFILNMKKDTVRRWISGLLCACVIVPLIGSMFITGSEKANAFLGSFLYATGFSCILFYIVLLLRKDIIFKNYPAAFLTAGLAVLAFASYYRVVLSTSDQEFLNTALLGEMGRYEGLLGLFAYFGIFLLATATMKDKSVKVIFDVLIAAGILQAFVAVLQHIPGNFPSDFRKLPALVLMKDVHLSSGLAGSPIFYGSFLTIVSGIAVTGALYEKNIIRARIYGCGAAAFFLTGLFTSSVVPLIGIGTVVVISVITEFTAGRGGTKFEEGILKSSKKRLAALLGAFAVIFGLVFALQGINLSDQPNALGEPVMRDKSIAYTDSYYNLFIGGAPSPVNYDSHWDIGAQRSIEMITDHPLLGVGPDLMAKVQIGDPLLFTDAIDRSYNEYLYTAATRGIPSLIVYLVLLVMTFVRLFGCMKEFAADREKWFRPALLAAVIAYSVQAFFSASVVTAAPFFWLLLGMAHSKLPESEAKK